MPLTVLKRDRFYYGHFDAIRQPCINCAVLAGEFPLPGEQLCFPAGKHSTVRSGDEHHFGRKQGTDRVDVGFSKCAIEGGTSRTDGKVR